MTRRGSSQRSAPRVAPIIEMPSASPERWIAMLEARNPALAAQVRDELARPMPELRQQLADEAPPIPAPTVQADQPTVQTAPRLFAPRVARTGTFGYRDDDDD